MQDHYRKILIAVICFAFGILFWKPGSAGQRTLVLNKSNQSNESNSSSSRDNRNNSSAQSSGSENRSGFIQMPPRANTGLKSEDSNNSSSENDSSNNKNSDELDEDSILNFFSTPSLMEASEKNNKTEKSSSSNDNKNREPSITSIGSLTPSQQLLKRSEEMFNTMAEIEQQNALLKLELERQKLMAEITNVRLAQKKLVEEEEDRKKEKLEERARPRQRESERNNRRDTTFRQNNTTNVPNNRQGRRTFSLSSDGNNLAAKPLDQSMHKDDNKKIGDLKPPTNNAAAQTQEKPKTITKTPPKITSVPASSAAAEYTVKAVQGIGGKLTATIKLNDGEELKVKEDDTLEKTGHKVVEITMAKVVLEKDGKKENLPIKMTK